MLKNILKNVQRPELDFPHLQKPGRPNSYLMSPPGYCPYPPTDESPVFNVSAADLARAFERVALDEPRVEKIGSREIEGETQADYVQYSALVGWPDTVTVRFIATGEGSSTLAVFSRAHYGYRDFGVNKRRIKDWIKKLTAAVGAAA